MREKDLTRARSSHLRNESFKKKIQAWTGFEPMTTSSYQANRKLVTLWVRSTPEEGETVKVHIFEQWEYDTSPKDWKIYYQGCSTISRVLIGREVWSKTRELSMEKTWSQRNYILSFSNRKQFFTVCTVKPRANGRNIVGQQLLTLSKVTCCVRLQTLLHVVACYCAKFETGQTFSTMLGVTASVST